MQNEFCALYRGVLYSTYGQDLSCGDEGGAHGGVGRGAELQSVVQDCAAGVPPKFQYLYPHPWATRGYNRAHASALGTLARAVVPQSRRRWWGKVRLS